MLGLEVSHNGLTVPVAKKTKTLKKIYATGLVKAKAVVLAAAVGTDTIPKAKELVNAAIVNPVRANPSV